MPEPCDHLEAATVRKNGVKPSGHGCEECLASGGDWVHLRLCLTCGHVGCCDNSPQPTRHQARQEDRAPGDPLVRAGRGLGILLSG